jgi:membrane peptidoglycan carboxypeptidase
MFVRDYFGTQVKRVMAAARDYFGTQVKRVIAAASLVHE